MKILITGASGLLGKKLFEILSKNDEAAGTYFGNKNGGENFHFLDVSDKPAVETFIQKIKPEVIIHNAALVDVDYCEENKEPAKRVNYDGTVNIIDMCKKYHLKLIYISSDYVFDGEAGPYVEESQTNPVNYYGFTKLEAEKSVAQSLDNAIIIRPAILYGDDEGTKKNFISEVVSKLSRGEKVVVDNKILKYPTLTDDVCFVIKKLIDLDARGTFHVSGEEAVTRYEWALKIAQMYGFENKNILPIKSLGKAKRPIDVRLLNDRVKRLIISFNPTNVDEGIRKVKNQKGCLFKMIYSARPDMLVLNQSASSFRINIGKQLAREQPTNADIVIPIPESGIYGATGYSAESKIPFYFGIIRDYFTNKTLFEPTLSMRNASLEKKLVVVPDIVRDKRIVLVDEAIVAGTTLAVAIEKLKKAGAKEIHIRIPAPPMLYNCTNGVLKEDANLIAKKFGEKKEEIEEGLRKHFGVNSLRFLSVEGFVNSLSSKCSFCMECFRKNLSAKIIRLKEIPDESRENGSYSIKRLCTAPLKKTPNNIGFYQTTIPPYSRVKNHYHQELDEFLYFITSGKVRINGEVYEFSPGDILILPPKSPHEIFSEDKEVRIIAVKLPNTVDDKVNV
jgi:dTDP-4-dehydrorhamnose reductase